MYHDQALIPVKTLDFDEAVNVTLGLPIVRTSPDHGTAFDIAGTGRANPTSLIAALSSPARIVGAGDAGAGEHDRRSAAAARRHPPARPRRQEVARTEFPARPEPHGRIARAAGPLDGATVIEIGPGPGGLTRALLAHGARRVIAIERDARAIAALGEIAAHYPGRLDVVEGDALTFDPRPLPRRWPDPHRRQPALQYRDAAAVRLAHGRALAAWYDQLVLMFQREVAERIVAPPGSKTYGRLSVLTGWRTQAKMLFDIAPTAFVPPPKVTSSVVRLVPRADPLPCDRATLERVTAAAFGQRRKMLRQSLKTLGVDPLPLLAEADLDPAARAEDIPVEGFVKLARALRTSA